MELLFKPEVWAALWIRGRAQPSREKVAQLRGWSSGQFSQGVWRLAPHTTPRAVRRAYLPPRAFRKKVQVLSPHQWQERPHASAAFRGSLVLPLVWLLGSGGLGNALGGCVPASERPRRAPGGAARPAVFLEVPGRRPVPSPGRGSRRHRRVLGAPEGAGRGGSGLRWLLDAKSPLAAQFSGDRTFHSPWGWGAAAALRRVPFPASGGLRD